MKCPRCSAALPASPRCLPRDGQPGCGGPLSHECAGLVSPGRVVCLHCGRGEWLEARVLPPLPERTHREWSAIERAMAREEPEE